MAFHHVDPAVRERLGIDTGQRSVAMVHPAPQCAAGVAWFGMDRSVSIVMTCVRLVQSRTVEIEIPSA